MIEKKQISIVKQNTFDKGFALFVPYEPVKGGPRAGEASADEIVKAITYAVDICLILSRYCLSQKVRAELEWASGFKDTHVSVIAKSEDILNILSGVKISSQKIDGSLSYDYIRTTDKNGVTKAFLLDGPFRSDDSIEKAYFHGKDKSGVPDFEALSGSSDIFIVGDGFRYNDDLYGFCRGRGIRLGYLTDAARFDRDLYDAVKNAGIGLYVSKKVIDGVWYVRGGKVSELVCINGIAVGIAVSGTEAFCQPCMYKSLFADETGYDVSGNVHIVSGTDINPLGIVEENTLNITVHSPTMKDFADETFDRSEAENHNAFCDVATRTKYVFTLFPPYFDDSVYTVSSMYDSLKSETSEWKETFPMADVREIRRGLGEMKSCVPLSELMCDIEYADMYVEGDMANLRLSGYRQIISGYVSQLEKDLDSFDDILVGVIRSLKDEEFGGKIKVFDDEIEVNLRTIEEKEKSAEDGESLFINRSGIDSKKRQVENLKKQKDDFVRKYEESVGAEVEAFLREHTNHSASAAQAGDVKTLGSLASVITNMNMESHKTDLDVFGEFLNDWYDTIKKILGDLLVRLKKIESEDLPEEYLVYERDGGRYIVISDIKEYYATAKLCEKYSLQCVSGRR